MERHCKSWACSHTHIKKSTEGQIMKWNHFCTHLCQPHLNLYNYMKSYLIICSKTSSDAWDKNTKLHLQISQPDIAITTKYQKSLHKIQIYIKEWFGCIIKAHKRQSHWTTTYKGLLVWVFLNELQSESNSSTCCRITCDRLTGSGRTAHSFWMA